MTRARRTWVSAAVVAVLLLAVSAAASEHRRFSVDFRQNPPAEVIAEVRVHGNHVTPDDEIVALSGIVIGAPFGPTTIADSTRRLHDDGRFDEIDVLKRFASIVDLSQIVIVIVVNEGPVRIDLPDAPGAEPRMVRRSWLGRTMWLPIVYGEDGYGLTYGARLAWPGVGGERGRVSAPLTWGGFKQAGIEYDRTFARGPVSRIEVGAAVKRRRNPAFDLDDDRRRIWGRVERAAGPLRTGVEVGRQDVSFGQVDDGFWTVGADVAFDTRLNPLLPRNAVFAQASWERVDLDSGPAVLRTRLDGRGYVGLIGQSFVKLEAVREDANRRLPPYLRSLLGGWSNLRGFEAGSWTGDTLVTGSIELVLPLTSAIRVGKFGVSAFVDTGAAYDKGERLAEQTLRTGIGGSTWITVPGFRMSFAVARGRGASTRAHFGIGIEF
jgi:outer membrane protein assembly factor BamA